MADGEDEEFSQQSTEGLRPQTSIMAGSTQSAGERAGLPMATRPAKSDRWYGAALLAVLAFVFVSLWLRAPVVGYTAAATLGIADSRGRATERLMQWLAEPQNQDAIRQWLSADVSRATDSGPAFEADDLQLRFRLQDATAPRLELVLQGRTAAETSARLDVLVQRFSQQYFQGRQNAAQDRLLAEHRQRLADARLEEQVLERDVNDALTNLQSATTDAEAGWRAAQTALLRQAADAAAVKRREPPQPLLNPQWQALYNQIAKLETERRALLVRFTPKHPLVRALEVQLADLEDELAEIPQHLTNGREDNTKAQDLSAVDEPDEDLGHVSMPWSPGPELATLTEKLDGLRSDLTAARSRRCEAEAMFVEAGARQSEPEVVAHVVAPAAAQEVLGGSATRLGLWWAIVAAVLAAGGYWWGYRMAVPERLETDLEVADRTQLPLVGAVESAGSLPQPELTMGERCVWWLLRGGEGTLAVLIVVALVTIICDSALSRTFLTDPLRAANEVLNRWL